MTEQAERRSSLVDGVRSASSPAKPASLLSAFAAGVEMAHQDLRVPGVKAEPRALLPYIDHDHDGAPASAKLVLEPAKASSTAPPDHRMAEHIAALTAASLDLELTTLRYSKDRDAKHKLQDILERAGDSATRKKLRELHAASNGGETLDEMIASHEGLDDHARKHASSLVSDKRDAATDKLAAMDPKTRADLEDKAATWADQVMDITQGADRDDSEHADKIASILGPRSPEEIEVIRTRIRLQSSGTDDKHRTTLYEQLDRSFTGNDKDIALAGLAGNHATVAARQLVDAAANGDPERVHRIVKELDATKLAELRATNPVLLAQVASNMPADQRTQIEAALAGRRGEAEGGRIESILQPVDVSVSDAHDLDKARRKLAQKDAQDPERLIEELQRMSPADLAEARKTHGESWDRLIAERYKDVDSTVRLRIEAAARGDRIGERALRLRQGMRTFDQRLIDQALANPDLQSADPTKKATAEAERSDLEARMRAYDATDQRTRAIVEGRPTPETVVGRSTRDQLDAYYVRAKDHDTEAAGLIDRVAHVAEKDERMERIRERAHVDKYAATEMWSEGDARASTKVRRAELAGDAEQKATILENLDSAASVGSSKTLAAQSAAYREKFGGRDMLAGPDLSAAERMVTLVPGLASNDRSAREIAAELARDDMSDGELRVQHVRETGVLADRTREQRVAQMKERRDNSHSGWLAGSEMLTHMRGGNRGSEHRLAAAIDLMERGNAEGVDDREQARRDKSATGALALQREEKQREAAKVAQALSIASKIAAILTANPALFVAVDAGFGALRIAAQEMIANEAYAMTPDLKHLAVDAIVDMATAKFASMGKGVAATQAAKGAQRLQRVGMGVASVGGAAAHSAIDGDDGGGAVFHAALGTLGLNNYVRGKLERLVKGSGRLARGGRAVLGTMGDAATSAGLSGGQVDAMTVLDAGGNTVQDRMHGHAPGKGTRREHEQVRHATADVDAPRRNVATEDTLRRASETTPDPRTHDVDAHARDGEARRRAEAAYRAHAHLVEDPYDSTQATHAPAGEGAPHATADGAAIRRVAGTEPRVVERDGQRIVEIPAHASPLEAERMVAGTLAEARQRALYADRGVAAPATSGLGAGGDGRRLSPEDHRRIAELRVAREQLGTATPDEIGEVTRRVQDLERSMGIDGDAPDAAQRRRAVDVQIDVQADAARRAAMRAELDGAKGHPGIEVHSHLMGVLKPEVFRQRAAIAGGGEDTGSWRPVFDKLAALPDLERARNEKLGKPNEPSAFQHERKEGKITRRAKAGDANAIVQETQEQIRVLEARLKEVPESERPAYHRAIEALAEEATRTALTATAETPFDGAYVMRDALVRTTFGSDAARKAGNTQDAFDDVLRETVLQLAEDGVGYSEQSTGVGKLGKETSPERIRAAIDDLVAQGRLRPGEVEIQMLGMMKTANLGGADERVPGSGRKQTKPKDHAKESATAFELARTRGVIGNDYGGPEHNHFNAEGQRRFLGDYDAALAAAGAKGQPFVLRPHVGEGAVDTVDGAPFHTDKNRHIIGDEPSHYLRARDNIETLLAGLEARHAEGTLDPTKVIVRFGHATHATPDQAKRMRALGIIAEVNLGSNVATGAASQTEGAHGKRAAKDRLDDHALPSMLFYGTDVLLSTDGGSVMNTSLREEYGRAFTMIEAVLSGAQPIRVTEQDAMLDGKQRGRPSPSNPNLWELDVSELTAEERARFTHGYEKLHRDAESYYRRRPDPSGATAASPLGGAHHIDRAVKHGLIGMVGTASFSGTSAQVEAAARDYAGSGATVTWTHDRRMAIVTVSEIVDEKVQPKFTTTLNVAEGGR